MYFNIKYPNKISNDTLYKRTKETQWSKKIKIRRLRLIGHIMRLNENTPAYRALEEALIFRNNQKQGHNISWIKQVNKDLAEIDSSLFLDGGCVRNLAEDRVAWSEMVVRRVL